MHTPMDAPTVYSGKSADVGELSTPPAARLLSAFDGLPDVAQIAVDHDLRVIWCAGGVLTPPRQRGKLMVGRPLADFLPPETFSDYAPHFRAALEGRHTRLESSASAGGPTICLTDFISVHGADGEI